MSRLTRRSGWLLAALAVSAAVPTAALATPPAGTFPTAIEALAEYDPQSICDPVSKPGALALRSLLTTAYKGTGDLGIVRACNIGGTSEHKEGRAWDWAVNAYSTTQDAQAKDLLAWMLATDAQGNTYAMARRLGIMYMIYNQHIWSASQADAGWRPYTGPNPHTDHVHISLTRVGGAKTTSYWGATTPVAPPTTSAPVLAKWAALGGATGTLGAAVRTEYDVPGGRAQDYQRGRIYWSSTTGAAAVYGSILARYSVLGGPAGGLGLPVEDESDVYSVPGARVSLFQNGRVYWSPTTGLGSVQGAIAARHLELGGAGGPLGLPTADDVAVAGGRASTFQGGRVVWGPGTGAHAVGGDILGAWDRSGGAAGPLGLPTSEEGDAAGGARVSVFEGGRVLWSLGTGAVTVQGPIADRYAALGGAGGPLGLPLAEGAAAGQGLVSRFAGGRLFWGATSGTHLVVGAIAVTYDRLGGAAGPLGLPVTDELDGPGGGRVSTFQGGTVYWSPATGAVGVYGDIAARYDQLGGYAALGLPVGDERAVPGGRVSTFERGRIFWGPASGAHAVVGAIAVSYDQSGGPAGPLGLPTTEELDAGGQARSSAFQGGRIIWSPDTGAHPVTGAALAHLDALGGFGGFLGLPVSDLVAVTAAASRQSFRGGQIYVSGNNAESVRGLILGSYLALGGPTGSLGLPVSDEYDVPGGRRSDFERGALVFDVGTGRVTRR